jgi:hypothetical protein
MRCSIKSCSHSCNVGHWKDTSTFDIEFIFICKLEFSIWSLLLYMEQVHDILITQAC